MAMAEKRQTILVWHIGWNHHGAIWRSGYLATLQLCQGVCKLWRILHSSIAFMGI